MAYYNRNNRYNGGNNKKKYNNYNNGYNRYNDRQNENPAKKTIDLTQFQNTTLDIIDINKKMYTINLNLPNEVIISLTKSQKKFKQIAKGESNEQFEELYEGLKEILLAVLNNNPDGVIYQWDEIKSGFDNIFAMGYTLKEVLNEYTRYANMMKNNE